MTTHSTHRENDLRIAAFVADEINNDVDSFILTGSYSIDLLTGAQVKHNDIDANIFTKNMKSQSVVLNHF